MAKKILALKSSIMGENSFTNELIDKFIAERKRQGHEDQVRIRDLSAIDLPVLDNGIFSLLRGAEQTSERLKNAVALSDTLIDELKCSDLLLIGAPMYNLNVPTQLKNWFDLVARARVTFQYTKTYPIGLVEGVDAIVFSSRGGVHVGHDSDAVTPYLRSVLGLMGITNVEFVYAEGMDIPQSRVLGIEAALKQVVNLARHPMVCD